MERECAAPSVELVMLCARCVEHCVGEGMLSPDYAATPGATTEEHGTVLVGAALRKAELEEAAIEAFAQAVEKATK
jgi:hypothetical protein